MVANIIPTAESDGIIYCTNVPLTSHEADLNDGLKVTSPVPVIWGQEIIAVVKLAINGYIIANSTYVVLQGDMGDGTWFDVAWVFWNGVMGSATFVLAGGGLGAMNNAIQQTRNIGSVPSPQQSGSNALPLGGRIRFTGQTVATGGSSSAPGQSTQVTATITFRLQPPR